MAVCSYGDMTRELHALWRKHNSTSDRIPVHKIASIFHSLNLFPAKSQIYEMLNCASDCSNRLTADYITFGEFCVFATELKNCYENHVPCPQPLSRIPERFRYCGKNNKREHSKSTSKYEVFLGGSCNPTSWRQDIAIPLLKSLGITYYNPQKKRRYLHAILVRFYDNTFSIFNNMAGCSEPSLRNIKQVSHWGPELIELENQAKQTAEVLFFVIDNQTRSVASIIEAAHISGCQKKLILVIKEFQGPGQEVLGEPLSEREYHDLCHGHAILQDLVERQGIPVFTDIGLALHCVAKMLREGLKPQDLSLLDHAQPVRMAHIQLGDKLIKLREAFDALDTSNSGILGLNDVCLAFRIITNYDLTPEDLQTIIANHQNQVKNKKVSELGFTFDQFCCIVAEFKNKDTDTTRFLRSIVMGLVQSITLPVQKFVDWMLPRKRVRCLPHQRNVYLGGSCGQSVWREDLAIPILKKNGLTYFNPQVSRWSERLIPIEAAAMENCHLLLFVITNSCRSLAAMAVAAHYIGLGCNAVLCIQYLKEDCILSGDKLTKQAVKDYNRGRMYLSDLANREGIPVFEDIEEAIHCVVQKSKNGSY